MSRTSFQAAELDQKHQRPKKISIMSISKNVFDETTKVKYVKALVSEMISLGWTGGLKWATMFPFP